MTNTDANAQAGSPTVKVWDPAVRLFHWSFAATITAAWLTSANSSSVVGWHEALGYAALVLAVLRIGWGFFGTRHARFADFVHPPKVIWHHGIAAFRRQERRCIGHNPLGGVMILTLLGLAVGLAVTGYLMTTHAFFGVAWMEAVHKALSNLFLILVPLHVFGVVWQSMRHRENLTVAMLTGRKRVATDCREPRLRRRGRGLVVALSQGCRACTSVLHTPTTAIEKDK